MLKHWLSELKHFLNNIYKKDHECLDFGKSVYVVISEHPTINLIKIADSSFKNRQFTRHLLYNVRIFHFWFR
jgi:hypothetical protein